MNDVKAPTNTHCDAQHTKTWFYLIRHGETVSNVQLRIQGQQDGVLSEHGHAQCRAMADRFSENAFDHLYASDLGRARDTARYLAKSTKMQVITDSRLRERHFGVAEGLSWNEVIAQYPEAPENWDKEHYTVPEGETRAAFRQRFMDFFNTKSVEHAGQNIAVVTHGGVLNFFFRQVIGLEMECTRTFAIRNTSISIFSHENDPVGWCLDTWGDVRHLKDAGLLDMSPG